MYSRLTSRGRAARRFTFKTVGMGLGVLTLSGLVYAFNQSSSARPTPYALPATIIPVVSHASSASLRPSIKAAPIPLISPQAQGVDESSRGVGRVLAVPTDPLPDRYASYYPERRHDYPSQQPPYAPTHVASTYGLETHTVETHTLPTHTLPTHTLPTHTLPTQTAPTHTRPTRERETPTSRPTHTRPTRDRETPTSRPTHAPHSPAKSEAPGKDKAKPAPPTPPADGSHIKARDKKPESPR